MILLPLFLSACGGSGPSTATNKIVDQNTQRTIAAVNATAPPGARARPLKPGESGTVYTPDGLPALQPARGINADMLFAEKINDSDARFDRLETAVTDMRREFEAVKPAIVRLVAVEDDMQALLKQLETLVQNPPAPVDAVMIETPLPEDIASPAPAVQSVSSTLTPAAEVMPAPLAAQPETIPVTAPQNNNMIHGQGLRIGEHANMTRLVIDLSGAVKYSYDLDNAENLLLIELPGADWTAAQTETLKKSPLVQSWTIQPMENGQGSRLIINLHKAVKVVKDSALSGPARIVFDLQAGG